MKFSRVKPGEWFVSFSGALILVALFMPWYGEDAALASVSLLDVILLVVAIMALVLPLVLARSRHTNVPVSFETLLSDLATIASVVLLVKLLWNLDGGLKTGFFIGLAGSILLTVAGWRSTSRES